LDYLKAELPVHFIEAECDLEKNIEQRQIKWRKFLPGNQCKVVYDMLQLAFNSRPQNRHIFASDIIISAHCGQGIR